MKKILKNFILLSIFVCHPIFAEECLSPNDFIYNNGRWYLTPVDPKNTEWGLEYQNSNISTLSSSQLIVNVTGKGSGAHSWASLADDTIIESPVFYCYYRQGKTTVLKAAKHYDKDYNGYNFIKFSDAFISDTHNNHMSASCSVIGDMSIKDCGWEIQHHDEFAGGDGI